MLFLSSIVANCHLLSLLFSIKGILLVGYLERWLNVHQTMSLLLVITLFVVVVAFLVEAEATTPSSSCPAFLSTSCSLSTAFFLLDTLRGGSSSSSSSPPPPIRYGRISNEEYVLTPEQIERFHKDGCITIDDVLNEEEVSDLEEIFNRFLSGEIHVPDKDFCDMSKPFGIPPDQWSIVNCMLPTKYYPPMRNNVYEKLTSSIAKQLFPQSDMVKDYDQLLNKRPGKTDAVFAWHQDMAYWPGPKALGVDKTDTCTFSLAIDDSEEANGCLRYVPGSGASKQLRPHKPALGDSRDDGHALAVQVGSDEIVTLAPAKRGSVTIHDEYVVHGSAGNTCADRQRRTYVLAYRAKEIVDAERRIGFTHSHNDQVNWDTFNDGEAHRVAAPKKDE